jgi:hypothetical protein
MATSSNNQPIHVRPDNSQVNTYMITATMLVAPLVALSWQYILPPHNTTESDKNIQIRAKKQKNAVGDYQQSVLKQLKNITHSEKIVSLINDSIRDAAIAQTGSAILDLRENILNKISCIKTVRIYAPRQAQRLKDSGGNIRFVELNMINNVEHNKISYPEAVKTSDNTGWEIHWVIAIADRDTSKNYTAQPSEPLAIVHLTTHIDDLLRALTQYDQRFAQTKLIQNLGTQQQLTLMLLGSGIFNNRRTSDVPLSFWQVAISPSTRFEGQKILILLLFIMAIALSLAVSIWASYQLAHRHNQSATQRYKALQPNGAGVIAFEAQSGAEVTQ